MPMQSGGGGTEGGGGGGHKGSWVIKHFIKTSFLMEEQRQFYPSNLAPFI